MIEITDFLAINIRALQQVTLSVIHIRSLGLGRKISDGHKPVS